MNKTTDEIIAGWEVEFRSMLSTHVCSRSNDILDIIGTLEMLKVWVSGFVLNKAKPTVRVDPSFDDDYNVRLFRDAVSLVMNGVYEHVRISVMVGIIDLCVWYYRNLLVGKVKERMNG